MNASLRSSVRLSGAQRVRGFATRVVIAGVAVGASLGLGALLLAVPLPPVPVPVENPITESKRVLGKILFWDEQLSTSNAVSCGTCHIPGRAGADPRLARTTGVDGIANNADDIFGSPGVIKSDASNRYQRDVLFGLYPQITTRAAQPIFISMYSPEMFWDGRARNQFIDPDTGAVAIAAGGALENQVIGPPLSDVEMAHANMDWGQVVNKLYRSKPLNLATTLPVDVAGALVDKPDYGELFRRAFGDRDITAKRIAFAIATYERTLVPNQTLWDIFDANPNSPLLTPQQRQTIQNGLNAFNASNCNVCHTAPMFTDNTFRNVGLRPFAEDTGRQQVTGLNGDRGRFKVPTLRNTALKRTWFHNGQAQTLGAVLAFYAKAPPPALQQFIVNNNQDQVMANVAVPPQAATAIQNFITVGLTDPRVQNQTAPFDKPTLFTERAADQNAPQGGGVAGSGGITPTVVVQTPSMIGIEGFRIGLSNALGGVSAQLGISSSPPVGGRITPEMLLPAVTTSAGGAGLGVGTAFWKLSPVQFQPGQAVFVQWFVSDPAAPSGQALSNVARLPMFCGSYGCPTVSCYLADITGPGGDGPADGQATVDDFLGFLNAFADATGCPSGAPGTACNAADLTGLGGLPSLPDGDLTIEDFLEFLTAFGDGC